MHKRKIVTGVLVLLAGLVALLILLNRCNTNTFNNGKGMNYNPDIPQKWNGSMKNQSTDGIKIPGFGTIYFPAKTSQVQLALANPENNTCYFIYTLHLNDPKGEILYSSCRIDPGMALTNITLNRTLEVGEYTLYIEVVPYDSDTDVSLNTALLKAPLVIVNQ